MAVKKTKNKVSQVLHQARESLKILETLEKETLAKARTFVRNPLAMDRKRLTNEKILASLKSLGVASQSEVDELQAKVEHLENELSSLHAMLATQVSAAKRASKSPTTNSHAQPSSNVEAIPKL
jgi:polyhydroxyalkanoate synthesis regulator phasin